MKPPPLPTPRIVLLTPTGQPYVASEPFKTVIKVEDICLSLSRLPRFGGRFSKHVHWYSYAQHCVLVSNFCSKTHALVGLFHDAAKAYVSNTSEGTNMGNEVKQLENLWLHSIATTFRLDAEKLLHLPSDVKQAHRHVEELELGLMERRDREPVPSGSGIIGLTPRLAQQAWIDKYRSLSK